MLDGVSQASSSLHAMWKTSKACVALPRYGSDHTMLRVSRSQDTIVFEVTLRHILLYCVALSPGAWLKVTSGRLSAAVGCLSLAAH